MLKNLFLRNFKSARHLNVPLGQLTVLSGLNGSGKSTVLQAIGLLRQSLQISHVTSEQRTKLSNLYLRGPLVQLGMAGDVLSQRASEYEVEITLNLNTPDSLWAFTANIDKEYMDADTLSAKDYYNPNGHGIIGKFTDPKLESSAAQDYLNHCHFQFLQADRLTPRTHYDRSDTTDRGLRFLGTGGQYTPDFLAEHGDKLVVSSNRRCSPSAAGVASDLMNRIAATPKLYDQVCGWLQHLSPGVRLNADRIEKTDLVTLGFSYASTELAQDSERRRPANVGFGLTYSLPIIAACLSAPSGALLLLENPEAHLHPQGQAALGALLAKCASDGVQIIVETHSDHVLNGIRIATRKGLIKGQDIQLCHFTRNIANGDSQVETPSVLPNGELSAWPDGFFDEWEKNLEALLG